MVAEVAPERLESSSLVSPASNLSLVPMSSLPIVGFESSPLTSYPCIVALQSLRRLGPRLLLARVWVVG